jgi:hypothetical protein
MNVPSSLKNIVGQPSSLSVTYGRLEACPATVALLVGAFFLIPHPVSATPPTLTYLFPAGAQRGTTVEVTAGGTFERWPVQAWIDRKGVEIKPATDKGKLTITVAADAVPGTYWLRLFDDEGASALRPFLVGMLPEMLEQEPNDEFKKPQALEATSVTVNGRLEKPGDVDCYALKLTKGQTLVASLEAHRTLGSPMDALLQVLSADGFVLEENNDFHGLDPQVVFTVPKDGIYIVRTFAFPAEPDASIRFMGAETYIYRLTLTTGGFADHAFPLAVARSAPGEVDVIGWNIPDTARKLTIKPTDDADSVLFHPQLANTVRVRVEPHTTLVQQKTNGRQQPQTIPLPATISGCLERADSIHAYHCEAKKGQKLTVQVEAQALGFTLNPVLRLLDTSGKALVQAEGAALGRDPEVAFTVPADGKYQIEVRDLHGVGSSRHLYRLRVVLAEPDFELKLATDRFVMTPNKPLDIPITIERRNGHDREIEIVAEGLPQGVIAALMPASVGPAVKSVTLRLSGDKPMSGPFRVVGKVVGSGDRPRPARAVLSGLNASSTDLWLMLTPPAIAPKKK